MGKTAVEVIVVNGIKWFNKKHIEDRLDHANSPVLTRKYHLDYRKHRYELVDEPKKQPNRFFLHEDLTLKIIMDCKTSESCRFVINTKQQTVIESIKIYLKEKI